MIQTQTTSPSNWIRKPAVSGRFYPNDAAELNAQLDQFLEVSDPSAKPKQVTAIIAPHAGYIYSGAIAGKIYQQITVPPVVFILCPNHTGSGKRVSVWNLGAWQTPLGEVPVDEKAANELVDALHEEEGDREAHLYEHAIEVHLPFLKRKNPTVQIVPVVLGPLKLEQCLAVGAALAETIKAQTSDVLIVASTDMSHYIPWELAQKKDKLALNEIEKMNPRGLYKAVAENGISMCGFVPTTAALEAASILGATKANIIAYGSSGDTTHDYHSVVGYAAGEIR